MEIFRMSVRCLCDYLCVSAQTSHLTQMDFIVHKLHLKANFLKASWVGMREGIPGRP